MSPQVDVRDFDMSLVEIRRTFHRIPELGFQEFKTQATLLEFIGKLPSERLEVHPWRTGILVRVQGLQPSQTIAWRTDMDGLPIQEDTGYSFTSIHEGFMHACGHDVHMTVALGLLHHFVHHPLADNLLFIFQPAEEGPGGALPMMQSEEWKQWQPDAIFALHVAPEHPVGVIATRPGILFANTSELFIDLLGKGGHAAYPHRANDMVVAAAHLVSQLQTIVARNVDPLDSAVITIGKIEGGTKQNIIAENSRLEGTIRTLSQPAMLAVKSRIEAVVQGIETSFDCRASIDYGSNYCQVWNHEALTQEFMDFVESSDVAELVRCREAMTGEDFGYFLAEIPGFMFWLGVDTPYGLHHAKLTPNEAAIDVALQTVIRFFTFKYGSTAL